MEEWRGLEEEEEGDPRGEEVVDPDVVGELVADGGETEEAAEDVEGGEGEEGEEREGPEEEEGGGREEVGGEGMEGTEVVRCSVSGEDLPEEGLAGKGEADAEVSCMETGEEGEPRGRRRLW